MTRQRIAPYAALVLLAVLIDQWIKWLVETRMVMHQQVDVLSFFALYRTYNTGVAFSMFSWVGDKGLIVVALCVIAFMLYLAWRTPSSVARIGFALVIGGAVGNLIDRSVYGHVIDYLLFHTPTWSFAVFNLADVFISVGAGVILLYELFANRPAES